MVSAHPTTGLTYEDYLKTSDDERWELLNGKLVMAPSRDTVHQGVLTDLVTLLYTFVQESDLGRVYAAPSDVVLSSTNVVQPDLLFISRERERIITYANIQGAPDLAVEIVSPSTDERDRTVKRKLYADHGVREYWLVDPDAMTITVLVLRDGAFEEVGVYRKGQTLTSPTLKGFGVNLDDIFRP